MTETLIKCCHISKDYQRIPVLRDAHFSIAKGDLISIVGENACGKSTLLKILCGLVTPSNGQILIQGKPVKKLKKLDKNFLAYVPDQLALYPYLTTYEFLQQLALLRLIEKKSIGQRISQCLALTNLDQYKNKLLGHLSYGCQRRVMIAQALLHQPSVLLLDEPSNGLDPNEINRFNQLLLSLKGHTTIIMATHALEAVQSISENAILLSNGYTYQFDPKTINKAWFSENIEQFSQTILSPKMVEEICSESVKSS